MKKIVLSLFCILSIFTFCGCATKEDVTLKELPKDDGNISVEFKPTDVYTREGDYIYFGYYPQSLASEQDLIGMNISANENGYYINSAGDKFIKYKATPSRYNASCFVNGERIITDTDYFFKLEPIKWRVVSENGEVATIATTMLIDCVPFLNEGNYILKEGTSLWYNVRSDVPADIYANNWQYSDLRAFLNNDFKNNFSENEQKILQVSKLDNNNSAVSNDLSTYPWLKQNDTEDVFYIFSYKDVLNQKLGFNNSVSSKNDINRQLFVTDYTRARGAIMDFMKEYEFYGNGMWTLRSAGTYSCYNSGVDSDGTIGEDLSMINDTNRCVCVVTKILL